ncbi:DUF6412 domain-containing protein [Streptomyces sp. NPDC048606]|uniref:DUF6412 domain-containing protein n=1 Tax=Streptomyces sp. NPDC048606 TaxID=3154726 RepID=UPI00343E7128
MAGSSDGHRPSFSASLSVFSLLSRARRAPRLLLGLFLTLLLLGGALGLMAGEGGLAGAVVTLAVAVAAGAAALTARLVRPVPPHRIRTAIRDRERRTAFLPQRDPDASGRSRPRAPGRPLPTAA